MGVLVSLVWNLNSTLTLTLSFMAELAPPAEPQLTWHHIHCPVACTTPYGDFGRCWCRKDETNHVGVISSYPQSGIMRLRGMVVLAPGKLYLGFHAMEGLGKCLEEGTLTLCESTNPQYPGWHVVLRYHVRKQRCGISFMVNTGRNGRSILDNIRLMQRRWRRCLEMRRRLLAVAMGLHPRLGKGSPIMGLPDDLLALCMRVAV